MASRRLSIGCKSLIRHRATCKPSILCVPLSRTIIITSQYRFMSSTQQSFDKAKRKLNTLNEDPGNDTKLKIYALFKQATSGKVTTQRPGMVDFVARAKWDAWNSLGDMTEEEARQAYIDVVDRLVAEKAGNSSSTPSSSYETLLVTCNEGLRTITLNRPETYNAINVTMYDELGNAIKEADEDKNTVITAITGSGSYYSSGNELSTFHKLSGNDPEVEIKQAGENFFKNLFKFVNSLIEFKKPLIGVVNGPAIGIAVTTLGLFDAVYSSDKATFHTPFTALGICVEGTASYTFPRIMGQQTATEMLLFNKKFTAEQMNKAGLVTEVIQHDELQQEIWPRLQQLAKLPPLSLIYGKKLTRGPIIESLKQANRRESDRIVERFRSEECKKASKALFARKKK